ncbi:PilZ domain-containing protein [Aliidiomarina sedimenti]|uniref:PilZ domain-containing protein n=1 Tax=Aliidiomarina sedimenti TaxID=1933879 RepID=A0ABY0C0T6_9GAMM|nr:PilZ domain-containing protein [Aliidiomarina sedimenti]RUO31461.1 PilZ domain-containing protein [Aliidiomarina sedimenti]
MTTSTDHLQQARDEYAEYFAIKEALDINVIPLDDRTGLPDEEVFLSELPLVFRMAAELQQRDQTAWQQIRSLGEPGQAILNILTQQNQKLNALLGYLLRYEDDPECRYQAYEYGGAGIGFYSSEPFEPGQLVQLKLFLSAESAAIFGYGEIIDCEQNEDGYQVTVLFRRLREEDQELMVRAALHAQTRLLKKRASERANKP